MAAGASATRRAFLARALAATAGACWAGKPRWARADVDGEIAHPVDPPPSLRLSLKTFDQTAMYGRASTAVVGIPTDLRPGEVRPLVVLLPGGHHNGQHHTQGCWGWWSEYRLGDVVQALGRGVLSDRDFLGMARPDDVARFNRSLATTSFRGAVLVTPWCVGRQLDPTPHGAMVIPFLRQVVAWARSELPVFEDRASTGLGGMSSGGLWTIYAGSACADLFGTLVATQPFTEDLLRHRRGAVRARSQAQRLRLVTSDMDHQRAPTELLSSALRADGIEHELAYYIGGHSAQFAQGPGGLDAMLVFDRALRGLADDGTRRVPAHDGLALERSVVEFGARGPEAARAPASSPSPSGSLSKVGPAIPTSAVATAAVLGVSTWLTRPSGSTPGVPRSS